jgi:hypothetical protein
MSFLADILTHTAFFMILLPIFFFAYVSPVQLNQVVQNLFLILKPNLAGFAMTTSGNDTNTLLNIIHTISENSKDNPQVDAINASYRSNNAHIIMIVSLVFGIGAPFLILIAIFIEKWSGGNLYNLFISNLIVIAFMTVSEFAIVGLFLKNFVTLDGQFLQALFITQSQQPDYCKCWYVRDFIDRTFPRWIASLIHHDKSNESEDLKRCLNSPLV